MQPTKSQLTEAIAEATRKAFFSLFEKHPGQYYYCSLITSGEAHAPVIAAWSEEALDAFVADEEDPEEARRDQKWSYAESPFYCFGEEFFGTVNAMFRKRPELNHELSSSEWNEEYSTRLEAMEAAMSRLDQEGLFGKGEDRTKTVVLVEVMPPDYTNTDRARRLNPEEALTEWLAEAAE